MFDRTRSEVGEEREALVEPTLKNLATRQALGAFYTPLHVAKILANWAIREGNESVLEPCFGGCDFLEAIRSRFVECNQNDFESQIFGCDIDSDAFLHLSNRMRATTQSGNFLRGDFLSLTPYNFQKSEFSCVIGNPPYIKNERLTAFQRESIAHLPEDVHGSVRGKANLWAYFVIHALSFLAPGGRMAWVLPGNFLSADYSAKIKTKLVNEFEFVSAISVSERLFLNQGTEERTVVLLCDGYGKKNRTGFNVNYCADAQELSYLLGNSGNFLDPNSSRLTEYSQLTQEQARVYQKTLEKLGMRMLLEFGSVHIGIVLGDKKFFVRSNKDWKSTNISDSYIEPIVSKFSYLYGLQIKPHDIESWRKNGQECFFLNTRGKRLGSRVSIYLNSKLQNDLRKNCTFERREIWHQPDDGQICDAFIASLNHNGPRMVLNTEKLQATNSLYRFKFAEDVNFAEQQMVAISMHSTLSQLSAELVGRQLGSGALKLEPKEVLKIFVSVNPTKSKNEISVAFNKIDKLLRENLLLEATQVADTFLFEHLINEEIMATLRAALSRVRAHRLRGKNIVATHFVTSNH